MGLLSKIGKIASVAGQVVPGPWGAALSVGGGLLASSGIGKFTPSAQAPGFTPYAVTSGYGTSSIDPNAKTATYTLSPEMKAFRDQFYTGARSAMPTAEDIAFGKQVQAQGMGLFNRASDMDIGALTSDYYNRQQDILAPGREQEASRLADIMYSKGSLGHGVSMGGGYVNPQQFALQMAREQQNKELLLGAEDRVRNLQTEDFRQAGALYGLGKSYETDPYTTANTLFGYGSGIENLGANTMAQGLNVGLGVGELGAKAAAVNAGIDNQNYLAQLQRQRAKQGSWDTAMETIKNTDWSGMFNRGGGGLWSSGGSYDPMGRF